MRHLLVTLTLAIGVSMSALAADTPTADNDETLAQANAALLKSLTVYKSPTCGCCSAWVEYLEERGYDVTAHDVESVDPIKRQHGLTDRRLASCHTGLIDGYVIEGHVPVADIERLLEERPDVIGLSAPGMPMQSPGMMSIEPRGYDVLSFDANGNVKVFSHY